MILEDPYKHIPVLKGVTSEMLVWNKSGIYVDGTIGGGGHAGSILKRLDKTGRLIGLDKDREAVRISFDRLAGSIPNQVRVMHRDFSELPSVLTEEGIPTVDGVLLDLGVSSYQIDTPGRGFSFMSDGPLDMRMDKETSLTAADIVNGSSREEIEQIIRDYGEERQARNIANAIVKARTRVSLTSTGSLADTVMGTIRGKWAIKSCARVFQAFRIVVNQELDWLKIALDSVLPLLRTKGRFGVISYHSLEDRIVKQTFKNWAADCICPPALPQCICDHEPIVFLHTKRPVVASEGEVTGNPRARSARFRLVERMPTTKQNNI